MKPAYRTQAPNFKLSTDLRLYLMALLIAVPSLFLLIYFLSTSDEPFTSKLIISGLLLIWIGALANSIRQKFKYHMRTLSTLVEAIRTEEYSFRSSRAQESGDVGELHQQLNTLTDQLQGRQQKQEELHSLLEKIINQIDVAIIAYDDKHCIQLANPMAKKLLSHRDQARDTDNPNPLIGKIFTDTLFAQLPFSDQPTLVNFNFPYTDGRWQLIQQNYRHQGRPGKLLFITDLKQVLGAEEIKAWQRLIRVIAHEVNNSLTPISSISQSLQVKLAQIKALEQQPTIVQGLDVIRERANDLKKFIAEYAKISQLPEPNKIEFTIQPLLEKLQQLFFQSNLTIEQPTTEIRLYADPVLIEQLLINLIKNAIEASTKDNGAVNLNCIQSEHHVKIMIEDEGQGISNPDNLFVPFYTTKRHGSGIGLALCRQITQAHQGTLTLENRDNHKGAIATLKLPLSSSA